MAPAREKSKDALSSDLDVGRLAAWLHDSTLQRLEYIAAGGYMTEPSATELMSHAAAAAADLRDHLDRLDDDPATTTLEVRLRAVVRDARLFARHTIELALDVMDGSLDPAAAEALAAATGEALANARKHARASRVVVYCEEVHGRARVSVHDDGIGCAATTPGRGLRFSVGERLERHGGRARVNTEPGNGTFVTLVVEPRP
jgi:signal transduction histidine kinase